jgi:hypothetical protein
MRWIVAAASLAFAVAGCRSLRRQSDVPGVTPATAEQYGCPWATIEANWNTYRMAPVAAGAPLCSALGRYGKPFSTGTRASTGMSTLSLQYHPNDRYITVIAVRYDDTKVNRQLKRPVGAWLVQSYSVSK